MGSSPRGTLFYLSKRALDLVLTAVLLVLLAPLLALVAAAIVVESGRPVLFSHDRVGARRQGSTRARTTWELRLFRFYKFRSMVVDADPSVHRAHIESFVQGEARPERGSFKLQRDERITRVGRFIRATSIDELPQLLNVIRGEMSLVGPRPLPPYEVELYRPEHLVRFSAPSGVSGLWQVNGRAALPFAQMIELDLAYVRSPSLARDLWILARTLPAVLRGQGAG